MADRLHRALMATAVLFLVAGFFGWRSLRPPTNGLAAIPAAVPNPQLAQLAPYAAPLVDSALTVKVDMDSLVLRRDPFSAPPARVVASSAEHAAPADSRPKFDGEAWHVTTTLMSGTRRAALINDELVYVGDRLPDGSRLTSVERDRVVVTDQKGAAHTVAVAKEGNG